LRIEVVDRQQRAVLVVLAQVRKRTGQRRGMAEIDGDFGFGRRCHGGGRRRGRFFLAAGDHGNGGRQGKHDSGKARGRHIAFLRQVKKRPILKTPAALVKPQAYAAIRPPASAVRAAFAPGRRAWQNLPFN
jgi:hypothetical protein